ncbi:MAG: TonB-dependent receptor, plug [Fibrobacteres bacterium]|nr:TonB-dependent receptor, plug [Fibrobacterota bacterium]
MKQPRFLAFSLTLLAGLAALSPRAEDPNSRQLSLERLLDLDITSVSMRPQKMMEVASSIYVIHGEDIRRSGATRIQDVLNLVPGVWFGDITHSVPTGEIRENAIGGPNTLLWILDGVHIMNPVSSGIMFEVFDLPLGEIERIEVIKGPGGSIYGANAATGVISIFTKKGLDAEGLHASVEAGTQEYFAPLVRYGWEARENLFLTVWSKFKNHAGYDQAPAFKGDSVWAPLANGARFRIKNGFTEPDDDQRGLSGGINWDYQPSDTWKWTGWVSHYGMESGQYTILPSAYPDSAPSAGADAKPPDSVYFKREDMGQILADGRVDWIANDRESLFLNLSHWHYDLLSAFAGGARFNFDVTNLEFQNEYRLNPANHLSAGSNVRRIHCAFRDLPEDGPLSLRHPEREDFLFGAFAQDEMSLGPRWRITLGAKAESYTLTGKLPEVSPSLRLAYLPSKEMTFWGAASRSITTATYIQSETDFRVSQVPPAWYLKQDPRFATQAPPAAGKWATVLTGDDVKPVDYYTLEAGHRGSRGSKIQWDVSAFYKWGLNRVAVMPFDNSLQTVALSKSHPGDTIVPLYLANLIDREDFGGESVLRLLPTRYLSLEMSYTLFYTWNYKGLPIPGDPDGATYVQPKDEDRRTPRHIERVKADLELPWNTMLSANLMVTSPFARGTPFNYLTQSGDEDGGLIVDPPAMQYHLDLVLRKSLFGERMEVSAWGRNLLADPYVESYYKYTVPAFPHQVHRTFGVTMDWRM